MCSSADFIEVNSIAIFYLFLILKKQFILKKICLLDQSQVVQHGFSFLNLSIKILQFLQLQPDKDLKLYLLLEHIFNVSKVCKLDRQFRLLHNNLNII